MASLPDKVFQFIYADPPFFTGKVHTQSDGRHRLHDAWPGGLQEYLAFLRPRLSEMRRLLAEAGTLALHLDWHAAHHARVLLDEIFGSAHFLNEIIWSYRTGGVSRRWLGRKHDTILVYARSMGRHKFNLLREGTFRTDGLNYDDAGRPYKSTRKGRLYFHADGPALTDVWEIPFLSTVSLERTGYPTQKPLLLLERLVRAFTDPGDWVGDFFCGSGTTLVAADKLGRRWVGCDQDAQAVQIARRRLGQPESAKVKK